MTEWFMNNLWTILFYSGVVLVLILFRKRFEFQGIVALYRTKFGLKWMDKYAKKYKELVKLIGLVGIGVGFIGMFYSIYLIMQVSYKTIIEPIIMDGNPIILPGTTLAYTGGIVFPLISGWITIFIVIVVHEFSHGILARAHNIKVKASGIAFFGPILGAFVEPDEKQLEKADDIAQYSIFAAGPFSNFLLTIVVFAIAAFAIGPLTMTISEPAGMNLVSVDEGLPAQIAGMKEGFRITQVDGVPVMDTRSFQEELVDLKPNETISIGNKDKTYEVTATKSPNNASLGYLGVRVQDERETKAGIPAFLYPVLEWFSNLLFWIWFISLNVGIINLFPIFITDGARMLQVAFSKTMKDPVKARRFWLYANKICIILFLIILFVPMVRRFIP